MRPALPALLAALALLSACARSVAPPEPPPSHPAPSRAPSVLEPGAFHDPAVAPAAPRSVTRSAPSPALPPVRVSVVRVSASEGEDGHGLTVHATDPVAIDLDTPGGWPGRALATSLQVGALRFHTPGYPSATAMRFIAADARALPPDAPVSIQYGPDPEHRRVVAPSLSVPR